MHPVFVPAGHGAAVPVRFVSAATWEAVRHRLDPAARAFAEAAGFAPRAGEHLLLPGADGAFGSVLFGIDGPLATAPDRFIAGKLASVLPRGVYRFVDAPEPRLAALAVALGLYRFDRYRKRDDKDLRLEVPDGVDAAALTRTIEAVTLARDLVNTPANDMGPSALEQAARDLAARHGATVRAVVGDDLLAQNFPLIHAVGRAAADAPRLVDLAWGDPGHPKLTLVGKGVCFDTGGLDIKPDSAMLLMKKDMGGAATALALAHMIMERRLPVRLRVLVPAVENAIAGNAFRPRDVYSSRKGLTVEIGNTDAEGRLVLADALALADEETPDLLIDLGTLTGAARVALGPELPPFYTHDEGLAADLARHAEAENDPVWRLPLWRPYDAMLDSKVADLGNVGSGGMAGSVVCALFLNRFVSAAKVWLHLDIYAWNPSAKPARPEGGECQAARALDALIATRYGTP